MPRTFRRTTLMAALFGAFGLLLVWPLVSLGLGAGIGPGAAYVFVLWAAMIAAACLASRAGRRPAGSQGREPGEGG